jgi:hypothetical protein
MKAISLLFLILACTSAQANDVKCDVKSAREEGRVEGTGYIDSIQDLRFSIHDSNVEVSCENKEDVFCNSIRMDLTKVLNVSSLRDECKDGGDSVRKMASIQITYEDMFESQGFLYWRESCEGKVETGASLLLNTIQSGELPTEGVSFSQIECSVE